MKPHKRLEVWQKSVNLVEEIYSLTKKFPKEEIYGLVLQMHKSAISIPSNIAEGATRRSKKESIQFYSIARGSLSELDTQIEIASKLGYINKEEKNKLLELIEKIDILINGLLKHCQKNCKKLLLFFTFLLFHLFTLSYTAFQNQEWSVRAESMGGVFTAISDEPSGLYYNPAGISNVNQNMLQTMYTKQFLSLEGVDFSFMNISFVFPTRYLSLGLSYGLYNANNLYLESTVILGFAKKLSQIYEVFPPINFGLNLKYLTKKFNFDEEIILIEPELKNKEQKSSFSLDFGLNYKIFDEKLSLGFTIKDLNSPDLSIYENPNEEQKDVVAKTYCFGVAYNFGDVKTLLYLEDLTLGVDFKYRDQQWGDDSSKLNYSIGIETYLNFHTMALRFGINRNSINFGFGYYGIKVSSKLSFGLSYNFGISTKISDNLGNHRVGFDLKF